MNDVATLLLFKVHLDIYPTEHRLPWHGVTALYSETSRHHHHHHPELSGVGSALVLRGELEHDD